jgi:hypothetical protein
MLELSKALGPQHWSRLSRPTPRPTPPKKRPTQPCLVLAAPQRSGAIMDAILERRASEFTRSSRVQELSRTSFRMHELAAALSGALTRPVSRSMLIEAVSRDRVLLVSDLPAGPQPRQYHLLDAYSLGLYLALSRIASRQTDHPSEVNQALVCETAHLILGEAMPAQERRTRQTEFRVARGAAVRKEKRRKPRATNSSGRCSKAVARNCVATFSRRRRMCGIDQRI